ncbi:MAG TPA: choice-of-anchor N protein [Vicinamibacterales bacterium]|nr:choice-of-anchor N protein [Vicinamibacterales bacterium]
MRIPTWALLGLALLLVTARADALPLLQLDLKGGVYDPVTQTIVAPGGAFELFAILTPKGGASQTEIDALLNTTYYVSIALTPKVGPAPADLGSFTFGQTGSVNTYSATSSLVYGTPPIESMGAVSDPNDLPGHGIYDTYFAEFAFTFSPLDRAVSYNTADNPGGPTLSASGGSYYASFVGNSTLLASAYNLHFDLYDEIAAKCAANKTCTDKDVQHFAPFSHDAQTRERIPEPSAAAFLLLGSAIAAGYRLRASRSSRPAA